ncbi:hypothetical protein [Streptomyces sp. NP-1717]|uniref:hypothetical protein n=1 Tax=Streptomyces sp. NP-1717 TaxID=2704470 RepID=UPI001F5D453B|nr:hypothetical protein [Streptomyces sp. NP-1717]MCI3220859.1 hypothetical protein [Streptomyces sp. NP-1717]
MPDLIPPRTPLTPEQVELGFDYLLALQTGGGGAVDGRAEAEPELAFVLLRLAEDIVGSATAVDGEAELSADSSALDEVGCALLSALRDWARDSPVTAAPGIARNIIRFTVNVIPDPEHPDTADTLEAMRDEHLVLAYAVHSAPGAHRVHPVRTAMRTTVHSVGVLRRA